MIGNILHTFGSKILMAGISFLMLLINAHFLGAKGLGTVGLLVLNITIVILISNLVCGSILYYSSRLNTTNLLFNGYLWTLVSVFLFYLINQIYPLVESEMAKHIYMLSLMQAALSIHLYLLLGKEKVKKYNLLSLLQSGISLLSLLYFYFIVENLTVFSFIYSLYIAYAVVWILGIALTVPHLPKMEGSSLITTFKQSFSYGFYAQAANTFQLLNYRISYFFLDAMSGRSVLGVYTAGVQLSEVLLLPGRSISTVQYARISRRRKDRYARRITILFMKISFLVTTAGTLVLVALPSDLFSYLLGKDFSQIKPIIWAMSFGIVALSAEVVLSHYFSGTGRQKMNSISALIGLILTLIGCFTLIPQYGALGAALSTAISYSGMFVFLFILMTKNRKNRPIDFLPQQKDWKLLKRFVKQYHKRKTS